MEVPALRIACGTEAEREREREREGEREREEEGDWVKGSWMRGRG